MAIFASLIARLGFDTKDWTKGGQQAQRDLDALNKKTKGFFGDLKSQFGKGSLLGQSTKLLVGGGAIAGVNMAAKEFEALSGKISEMADAYRKGETSGKEMIGEILREIPILGHITKGFDALRNAITGENVAIENANELARESEKLWDQHKKRLDDNKQATIEWSKEIDGLRLRLRLASAAPGDKAAVEKSMGIEQQLADAKKKYESQIDSAALSQRPELDAQKRILKELLRGNYSQGSRDAQIKKIQEMESVVRDAEAKALTAEKGYQEERQLILDVAAAEERQQAIENTEKMMMDRRNAESKAADDMNKIRKEKEIDALEDRKSQLEDIMREGSKSDNVSAAVTHNMRFGAGIVQLQPQPDNPMRTIAKASLEELKGIKVKLGELKNNSEATVGVTF